MTNIAIWFEKLAGDEEIISAVLGKHYRNEFDNNYTEHEIGKKLSWPKARAILNYEYYNGFGGADCHPVFAWTETKLLTVTEYDGATSCVWFPRNPMDVMPEFDGLDLRELEG